MAKHTVKLRLTVDVEYRPNLVPVRDLTHLLRRIPEMAAGDGLMTGETPAEVETWTATVEQVVE